MTVTEHSAPGAPAPTRQAAGLAARADELTRSLAEHLERMDVPGAAFALARGDQQVFAAGGVLNRATGSPVTADSWFQIGSITKVFTGTLVMQLVDEGTVALDEPVRSYLPDLDVGDAGANAEITVRQLLTHSSGIQGDYFADFGRGSDAVARYVASLREVGMLHPPGAHFSYCNSGFSVLGLLLERLRGMGFDELIAERLFAPLGIRGGTLPEQAILHRAAIGHVAEPAGSTATPAPIWALPYASGPAGSTPFMDPAGLVSFARMHLAGGVAADGTRLLSEASAAEMQRGQRELPEPFPLRGIGLPWALYRWGDEPVIGHDGGTRGQLSFLRVHPATGTVVVLLTNGPAGGQLFREFVRPLFAELAGITPADDPVPAPNPPSIDTGRLAGRYRHYGVTLDVSVHGADVSVTVRPDANPAIAESAEPEVLALVPWQDTDQGVGLLTAEAEYGAHTIVFFPAAGPGGEPPGYLRMGSRIYVRDDR